MTDSARVVIVGAGFAGLSAVGSLRKAGLNVTVIDKNLYSTFQPLLYQVATGGLNPGDVAYPVGGFTGKRHARYIRGDLAAVDSEARVVRLAGGRELGYDYLILATGVSANYFGVKGAAENTFGLYISGVQTTSPTTDAAFERAVQEVTAATAALLAELPPRRQPPPTLPPLRRIAARQRA